MLPPANITWGRHLFYQWDLSLQRKLFNLPNREGMSVEFRADAYNAFNQTNWSALNGFSVNNVGSASFGQITQAFPARVLQFEQKIQLLRLGFRRRLRDRFRRLMIRITHQGSGLGRALRP